jgi:hypothetical protein
VSVEHRAAQFSQISRWLDAERLEPIDAGVIIRRHASARMAAPLGTPGPNAMDLSIFA